MANERETTDVLVVGGGLAGTLVALEAARTGARTTMVLKGGPGRGASTITAVSGGGFAAALGHTDPTDSPDEHLRDMLVGGEFLNDQRLARLVVEEAPARISYLAELGVQFEREGEKYLQRQAPGHSHPRSVMTPGAHMGQLVRTLAECAKGAGVIVRRGLAAADVLVADGRAVGVECIAEGGSRVDLLAGAVVLATGGGGRLYPVTSNPPAATGDGYALGYRAGARLRDMEFAQCTPAGLVHPERLRGYSVNHEILAHPQARILDGRGEPLADLGLALMRDLDFRLDLIRLFYRAIQAGRGTPHGGVYLDLREVSAGDAGHLAPGLGDVLRAAGIDPTRDLLEVAPEVHFFMGGLAVDEYGQTTVPGLYAAGETVGGCHGANRLTHNAFPEIIVLSPRTGKAAGELALLSRGPAAPEPLPAEWLWPAAPDLVARLETTMLATAGPVRTAAGLAEGLAAVRRLREEAAARPAGGEILKGLALRNLCQVAEMVLLSAGRRAESRGSHYRKDHPAQDDKRWLVNLLIEKRSAGLRLWERPVELPYLRPQD
ncbi:MAG: FAD-dependent oxidoreductase [Chloroflexota bacterium]